MAKVDEKKFKTSPCVMDREKGRGRMERRGKSYDGRCSEGRLWIFLAWGIVVIVFGLVIGGIFLNLRALTSSTNNTEIIPTYVNAISVIISGLMVLILFWRRNICLVFSCVFVNVGTSFVNGIAAILSGTLIIPPIQNFLHCTFMDVKKECHCLSPYSRSSVHLDYSVKAPVTLIFQETSSCHDIEVTLLQIQFALCGIYVVAAIICIIAAILALLVMRMERQRRGGYQDDTYEEIFTISNSNTPETSDSENEHTNMLSPSIMPCYGDLDNTLPDSDNGSSQLRSSLRRTQSCKQPRAETNNLDIFNNYVAKEKGNTAPKGKLKEHRRRDRRAVTLHNLDSKQLMLILSLQMRYLKENENSKSQVELSAKKLDEQLRRSYTPQPYHSRSQSCDSDKDVRLVRSHTPQPYQMARKQQMYENTQSVQAAQLNDFYENNIPPWERTPKSSKQVSPDKSTCDKRKSNYVPHYEEIDDVVSYMSNDEDDKRIYSNQTDIKSQKKKKTKPKVNIDSEESELSDIPPQRIRRPPHRKNVSTNETILPNNIPVMQNAIPNTPGRPKSYINAIDNVVNEGGIPGDLYDPVRYHGDTMVPHAQSQPIMLRHSDPANADTLPCRGIHPMEDIYAQPRKKKNPASAFQRIPDSISAPVIGRIPDGSDRRSAFHVVKRSSEAGTGIVGFINPVTNNNVAMYPVVDRRKGFDAPPPYSPPPCYSDCLTNSRDSSLKSSSSSHSANLSDNMYGKVKNQQSKFIFTHDPGQAMAQQSSSDYGNYGNYGHPQCYDGGAVYGNIGNHENRQYLGNEEKLDQLPQFSSQYRANYVINLDQEQPRVAIPGESSDSDEMETVI
ncbi:hypothetical protein SNE40_007228 [Patella caerulea]|uniref:Uncharacterized protein n=1 Tax=Patella caerulea TaxID=87958 RepID=A0AAN8JTE1_PATCE